MARGFFDLACASGGGTVLCGALNMAGLLNGTTLLAVQPEQKFIVRGLVLIPAVWMDVRLGRG